MELTADEARKIKVPRRWKEVYDLLEKQRDDIVTPVDTMGCEENVGVHGCSKRKDGSYKSFKIHIGW